MLNIAMIATSIIAVCVGLSIIVLVIDSFQPIEEAQALYLATASVASLACLCAELYYRQSKELHEIFLLGLFSFGLIAVAIGNQFFAPPQSSRAQSETIEAGAPATETGPVP